MVGDKSRLIVYEGVCIHKEADLHEEVERNFVSSGDGCVAGREG